MNHLRTVSKSLFAASDLVFASPRGPRILIYHRVGIQTGKQLEVARDDFVWQLDWLESNREIVDLQTALSSWEEPWSQRLVVLTFDDGYIDTYTTSFPMLKDRELPFTLYLDSKRLDRSPSDSLTWGKVDEMCQSGLMTLGAHTHSHLDLRDLSPDRILDEIQTCNQAIRSHLGIDPNHFAYPWGYWSQPADVLVRGTYASAVLGAPIPTRSREFDPYKLHRFPVQRSDGTRWFESRLNGGLLLEEAVRRLIRGYRGP